MTDDPKEKSIPEGKNPEKLPPTLAIFKTARDLHTSWMSRDKERQREATALEFSKQAPARPKPLEPNSP
jgi:hypothetical protein